MLCVVLGGGGHASVVIDALRAGGDAEPYAVLDSDQNRWGTQLLGVPIRGGDELLPELLHEGITCFVVGLGSVGDSGPRRRLFQMGLGHGLTALTVRHSSAICSPWAQVGGGSVLLACAVVNAGAILGENVIINSGAIVEHDCLLGDHVHVATGAKVGSTVRIGAGAHIGIGVSVRQRIVVGEGAVVGAGSVLVKDVEAWTVVAGVPARPMSARIKT